MHEFDADLNNLRRSKKYEAEHRSGDAFDGAMILLDDIVEILDLPDHERVFRYAFSGSMAALLAPHPRTL